MIVYFLVWPHLVQRWTQTQLKQLSSNKKHHCSNKDSVCTTAFALVEPVADGSQRQRPSYEMVLYELLWP